MPTPTRFILVLSLAALAAAPSVLWASNADEVPTMRRLNPVADSFIPLNVPGFELREMNKKRTLRYQVDSQTEVQLAVPLLIYFPIEGRLARPEVIELRHLYEDLAQVAATTQDANLQNILLRLDRILGDMGESRDIPGQYERRSRVTSEKIVGKMTQIPGPSAAPSPQSAEPTGDAATAGRTIEIAPASN